MDNVIRNEKDDISVLKKQKDDIFLCMECHVYWLWKNSSFEIFRDDKYCLFLSPKVDGKMIFTDHWKFLLVFVGDVNNKDYTFNYEQHL